MTKETESSNLGKWLKKTIQGGSERKLVINKNTKMNNVKGKKTDSRNKSENDKSRGYKSNNKKFKGSSRTGGYKKSFKSSGPRSGGLVSETTFSPNKAAKTFSRESKYKKKTGVLRMIPLGGLEEVGKNSMVIEYGNDIVLVDCGFQFPEEDMFGVDYVIPDVTYLIPKKKNVKAILITHGHLDHVGALPYILPQLDYPDIYGTKLSLGIIKKRLVEFGQQNSVKLIEVVPEDGGFSLGKFDIEFFRVNHSIPDATGIFIDSPAGSMVHTGDFKFDFTPLDELPAEFHKMTAYGERGVDVLFSDSTNALKPGHTISEMRIAKNLDKSIKNAEGRIIIAAFASLIGRVSQIFHFAKTHNRKVFLSGRSIENNVKIAKQLGFLKYNEDLVKPIKQVGKYPDDQVVILTTGAQGESMSSLYRIATHNHSHVKIKPKDTVVFSSKAIIGNERAMQNVTDKLSRAGANVVNNLVMDLHVSGHGQEEDLKMMMSLTKPNYLVPVHGNYHMRNAHAKLGHEMNIPKDNTVLIDNGDVIELRNGKLTQTKEKISVNYVIVDGDGMGELGSQVILDREIMAQNGALILLMTTDKGMTKLAKEPEIISRGFVYQGEANKVNSKLIKLAKEAFENYIKSNPESKRSDIKNHIRRVVDKHTHKELSRSPLVLPVFAYV